ncbi:unnamed protein product [Phyllotreta striolata]|uniref:Uncharacterized protein n=1 Tax=Phyllotreta striolata TaxID=444603 RepID=A0A9N9TX44_PHYSR|nr:unnamed protein product [Phyllotreta striolata]
MASHWEEFYSTNPPPVNFEANRTLLKDFCDKHHKNREKIVLVTSGGTTVPLEHNTKNILSRRMKRVNKYQSRQIFYNYRNVGKPRASEVLTNYIKQCNEPPWTSYFVKYSSIVDDQWGKSHFNWKVGHSNYHILRTGCFPYVKYHCTKRNYENLRVDDIFFRSIKVLNLGIPCLAYGIAAIFLIKHSEDVLMNRGSVKIYFLYPEDKGSEY